MTLKCDLCRGEIHRADFSQHPACAEEWDRRVADGVCSVCGENKPKPGSLWCGECGEHFAANGKFPYSNYPGGD